MSTLSKLKLVEAKKPTALPAIVLRRNKLSAKLWEQLQLAQAQKSGERYAPLRLKRVKNRETGERVTVESEKLVRPWWFVSENGHLCLTVRYGTRVLNFAKDKNAIEITNLDELIIAIKTLKSSVESGELDELIELASSSLKFR